MLFLLTFRDAATKTNRSPSFQGARGGKKSDSVPYSTGENWDDAPLPKGPTSSVTTFSLSKDRELVKMQSKSLGKARGRGHPSTQKAVPTVGKTIESPVVSGDLASKGAGAKYPAPRPGSKGIKVIEPLDKGDDEGAEEAVNQEQFEEASAVVQAQEDSVSEINDKPGLPLRGSGFSRPREGDNKVLVDPLVQDDGAEIKVESGVGGHVTNDQSEGWLDPPLEGATSQSSGQTPPTKRSSAGGGLPQQHQPQTSKPKRYSSQRQQKEKTGANVEQGERVLCFAWRVGVVFSCILWQIHVHQASLLYFDMVAMYVAALIAGRTLHSMLRTMGLIRGFAPLGFKTSS